MGTKSPLSEGRSHGAQSSVQTRRVMVTDLILEQTVDSLGCRWNEFPAAPLPPINVIPPKFSTRQQFSLSFVTFISSEIPGK